MRWLSLIALILLSLSAVAQVSMTVQLPPTGVLQMAQLWNMLLVSTSSSPILVKIEMRMKDVATNQPILTGFSRTITLNKGVRQIQAGDVTPVTYEYLSTAADRTQNGLLTAGNYIACYSVFLLSGDALSLLAEDCLAFAVEPVSPPLLNSPEDQSIVDGNLPQFSWIPPAPLSIFSDLNYDFVIVELRNGQSTAEAIQQNIPVYKSVHNKNLFVNYPVSALALDTAKKYAWTVTAKNGSTFAAQTETWTFRIKGAAAEKMVNETAAYILLKKELDATQFTCSGPLQVGYSNDAGDTTVNYEILSLGAGGGVIQSGKLSLTRGQNQLKVVLKGLTNDQYYLFRLQNNRKEYWNAKFIYNNK
ncbi:hypothetical protein [Chitinophaga silvisoli]|nr:hypothetical protein [Chitinophaga silvisoli]